MQRHFVVLASLLAAACATGQQVETPSSAAIAAAVAPAGPATDPDAVRAAVLRRDRAALAPALVDSDPAMRAAAVRGLGQLQLPGDAAIVQALLGDVDEAVRREAAVAAGLIGLSWEPLVPEARDALAAAAAAALVKEETPAARSALVWALGRTGGAAAAPALLAVLDGDEDVPAALTSIGLLARYHGAGAGASAAVADRAFDPDPATRAAAAFALIHLRDPAREELLSALVRDGDPQVRAFAARALGEVTRRPSLLEALLGDPVAIVRVEAARGLLAAAAHSRQAGVKRRADLTMEASFAEALHRSTAALALQLRRGRKAEALQPLVLLLRGDLPTAAAAAAMDGLAGNAGLASLHCGAAAALDRARGRVEALRACAPSVDPALVARLEAAIPGRAEGAAEARETGDGTRAAAAQRQPAPPSEPAPLRLPPQDGAGDVVLHTTSGTVRITLDDEAAPIAAANFRNLVDRGFYDGLTFHRLEPGFVIQGGDPRGDGEGGPGFAIPCENGPAPYARGTVGIALDGKDTGGSQFFITLARAPHLEGRYTAFGRVTEGMELLETLLPGDEILRAVLQQTP